MWKQNINFLAVSDSPNERSLEVGDLVHRYLNQVLSCLSCHIWFRGLEESGSADHRIN